MPYFSVCVYFKYLMISNRICHISAERKDGKTHKRKKKLNVWNCLVMQSICPIGKEAKNYFWENCAIFLNKKYEMSLNKMKLMGMKEPNTFHSKVRNTWNNSTVQCTTKLILQKKFFNSNVISTMKIVLQRN